jgi:hypothetical protein
MRGHGLRRRRLTSPLMLLLVVVAGCGRISFDAQVHDGASDQQDGAGAPIDGAASPPSFVQNAASANLSPVVTTALASPVTAGNLIVVSFNLFPANTAMSVVDTLGSTFSILGPFDSPATRLYIAYAIAPATGADSITVTMSPPAGTSVTVNVCEYTNVSQVSPYDTSASVGGNTLGVDGARSPDILTASPNEILIGVIIDGSVSAGTGMTMRSNFNGDVIEDVVAPVPGTYRITATPDSQWSATIVAFRGR